MSKSNRILAAVLFTDIKGYTAMVQNDEQQAKVALEKYKLVLKNNHQEYRGEIVNIYGDGSVSYFYSAVDAVTCAREMQRAFSEDLKVPVRIGINLGDVLIEEDDIYGNTVNVASRIESIGIPHSILFSEEVYHQIKTQAQFQSKSLGKVHFKNLNTKLEVYALEESFLAIPTPGNLQGKLKEKEKPMLPYILGTLMSLALLFAAYFFWSTPKTTTTQNATIPRIAILPFKNNGIDSIYQMVAKGFGQEILNKLSLLNNIHPVTYSASESLVAENKSMDELVSTLNVTHLLEGNIQISGNKMRIQVHLTDTKQKNQLWGNSLVRDFSMQNIFELQTDVAFNIVEALKTKLLPESRLEMKKNPTQKLEAYALIIDARDEFAKRTPESLQNAVTLLDQVKIIDPENALGYGMQAQVYATIAANGYQTWSELHPTVFELAQKALSIDQNSAEAYMALGEYYNHYHWDFREAEEMYQKAIHLKPTDANANQWLAELLLKMGKLAEAKVLNQLSQQLDPTSRSNKYLASLIAHGMGDIEESKQLAENLVLQYPDYPTPRNYLWYYYLAKQNYPMAIESIVKNSKIRTAVVLVEQENYKGVEELYAPKPINSNIQFLIHVRKKEWDQAYALLDELYTNKKYTWRAIQHVGQFKVFKEFKNNPRTAEALAKYGVKVFKPQEQLQ